MNCYLSGGCRILHVSHDLKIFMDSLNKSILGVLV